MRGAYLATNKINTNCEENSEFLFPIYGFVLKNTHSRCLEVVRITSPFYFIELWLSYIRKPQVLVLFASQISMKRVYKISNGQNLQNLENTKKKNEEIENELIKAEKKYNSIINYISTFIDKYVASTSSYTNKCIE